MQLLPALTKPRFSLLQVAIAALAFFAVTAVCNNWAAFEEGFRDGQNFWHRSTN